MKTLVTVIVVAVVFALIVGLLALGGILDFLFRAD